MTTVLKKLAVISRTPVWPNGYGRWLQVTFPPSVYVRIPLGVVGFLHMRKLSSWLGDGRWFTHDMLDGPTESSPILAGKSFYCKGYWRSIMSVASMLLLHDLCMTPIHVIMVYSRMWSNSTTGAFTVPRGELRLVPNNVIGRHRQP